MNTQETCKRAMRDLRNGTFIPPGLEQSQGLFARAGRLRPKASKIALRPDIGQKRNDQLARRAGVRCMAGKAGAALCRRRDGSAPDGGPRGKFRMAAAAPSARISPPRPARAGMRRQRGAQLVEAAARHVEPRGNLCPLIFFCQGVERPLIHGPSTHRVQTAKSTPGQGLASTSGFALAIRPRPGLSLHP